MSGQTIVVKGNDIISHLLRWYLSISNREIVLRIPVGIWTVDHWSHFATIRRY